MRHTLWALVSPALHADHFVPAANADNGSLIAFISSAVSQNVGNLPVSATSGGSTFRFEAGVPVPTSGSPGAVFGERAPTLGRVDIGVSLPIVSTSLLGTSNAQIVPFGCTTAQNFFGYTPSNPELSAAR